VIGALKRHWLIERALRAPEPGAPYAYVTTKRLLEVFVLESLRDLGILKPRRRRIAAMAGGRN
jgi:segregation and condensation protein B